MPLEQDENDRRKQPAVVALAFGQPVLKLYFAYLICIYYSKLTAITQPTNRT